MDVTLRDGAYVFDHQYSSETVKNIVACLDDAGIPYVEVGHGISVGAGRKVVPAGETDLVYAQSARSAAKSSKIGMIALPALANREDLDALRPYLDFVRIGVNADEIAKAAPLVDHAKKLGYEVFLQMIRSSRLSADALAESAKRADGLGVDVIYLVDSAGSWSPWEIAPVVRMVREVTKRPLGFHGHNHLGVALANALIAVQEGCQWIDASLRGVGRGAGNVPLELLLVHLKRMGLAPRADLETVETAVRLILEDMPLEERGIAREDYLPAAHRIDLYPWSFYLKIAAASGVEISELIKALGKIDKNAEILPEDLAAALRSVGVDPEPVFEKMGIAPA
jgi:4-hydroxy-2-oxovalerate aldolase